MNEWPWNYLPKNYPKETPMLICPLCANQISNWAQATGKTVKVNNIVYHESCMRSATIRDVETHQWQPQKEP